MAQQDTQKTSGSTADAKTIGGKITLGPEIVERIAGLVAREVDGVHAIGKSSIIPFGDKQRRGVGAEVGDIETALDLEVVMEYGVDIMVVVEQLKQRLAKQIKLMTGKKLVEVNVEVIDIQLPEEEPEEAPSERRLR